VVPHDKALKLILLASFASKDPTWTVANYCAKLKVEYPRGHTASYFKNILNELDDSIAQFFVKRYDIYDGQLIFKKDLPIEMAPVLDAGEQLGILNYLQVDETGLSLLIPQTLYKWRQNDPLRKLIEICFLCGFTVNELAADLLSVYGYGVIEIDLFKFLDLFVNPEFTKGDDWLEYEACFPASSTEPSDRLKLMSEPKDYVKWRLNLPVEIDSDTILNRLIADAYFVEKLIKSRHARTDTSLHSSEFDRIKLERDTIMKSLDRQVKIRSTNAAAGAKFSLDAAEEIRKIILDYKKSNFKLRNELINDTPEPSTNA
jgi:hypothetical protein